MSHRHSRKYLAGLRYGTIQIRFVAQIIGHLTPNGVVDPAMLYEIPYTDMSPSGLDGVFDDQAAHKIVDVLAGIERNAGGAAMSG